MKNNANTQVISDEELIKSFYETSSIQEKLDIFSKIQNEDTKLELLSKIPEKEKYKFLGKLKKPQDIAEVLNEIEDEESKKKTFSFIAKQYKGNSKKFLELLQKIDFSVQLPESMLGFNLNNLNDLNIDSLIQIQRNVENAADLKFKINEKEAEKVEYSFAELSAISAKIEELTAGIPEDSSELEKFYTIYYRIISNITYNHDTVDKTNVELENCRQEKLTTNCRYKDLGSINKKYDKKIAEIRRESAGLYGGLVDGKAICVGYATILHEALKKQNMKSLIVIGTQKNDWSQGHAWNQVQVDGKWYNVDATFDASMCQRTGDIAFMLRGDDTFAHDNYFIDTKNTHTCPKDCPLETFKFMTIVNQNRWWGGIKNGR